jgi:hypothetical protein
MRLAKLPRSLLANPMWAGWMAGAGPGVFNKTLSPSFISFAAAVKFAAAATVINPHPFVGIASRALRT